MNATEDQLRAALHDRAETFTADPLAREYVQHRIRRHRRRHAVGMAAAVAVTAGTAGLSIPFLNEDPVGRGALAPSSARPQDPLLVPMIKRNPPSSAVLRSSPFGTDGAKADVWFSTRSGRRSLCWSWADSPGEGGCSSSGRPHADHFKPFSGAAPAHDGEMSLGLAEDGVKSVTALLADGSERPGLLLRAKGFPYQVWQVGDPGKGDIATVVLKDGDGKVIKRIGKQSAPSSRCSSKDRPSTGTVPLAGARDSGPSATWAQGCLNFWSSDRPRTIGSLDPADSLSGAVRNGGNWWSSGQWWYGITGTATVRVEIQLPNGRRSPGRMTAPGWKNEPVKLFAGTLPQSLPEGRTARGHTVIGYDAGGKVLWRVATP